MPRSISLVGRRVAPYKAIDRQSRRGICLIRNRRVGHTGDPMFGTKNRNQIYSLGAREKINRPVAVRIKPSLVGDQSDSFATQ